MAPLPISIACAAYDRTVPLINGRVPIEGCDPRFVTIDPHEAFQRAYRSQDFDVTELSASSHILTTARGDAHYVAIPAFVSRVFRHSAFYVRTDRINSAGDLRGRLVGIPEYQMTAALWARGLLSDQYGIPAQSIRWRNGGLDKPGMVERTALSLPSDIELKPIPNHQSLSDMLANGEIDALISARAPSCFRRGVPDVARLWPDFRVAEEEYYARTRLFPIMHVIGIRRSLVETHPWLAINLLSAFTKAKQIALEELEDVGISRVSLPWFSSDVARAKAVMGPDLWPYGYEANRGEIEHMLRWSVEQGLSARSPSAEEIFAKGTL